MKTFAAFLFGIVALFAGAVSSVAVADEGDKWHQENVVLYPLIHASSHGDIAEVKRLLAGGANPNAAAANSYTVLGWAVFEEHPEIVKVLLSAGANPNATTNDGWTALMVAADKGNAEIIKMLLSAGADLNAVNKDGNTALDYAKEIVRILEEAGAE